MEPGKLRHRIGIVSFNFDTVATDGTVARAAGETTITRWGRMTPLTGREYYEALRQNFEVTHKVIVRALGSSYKDATKLQVTYDSVTYEVVSILENDSLENERTTMLVRKLRS